MFQRLAKAIQRFASGRTVLAAAVLYVLFAATVMNLGAAHISKLSEKPVTILDLQWGYSVDKTNEILGEYTPAALEFAAIFNATADFVYPWVYAMLFSLAIAWLGKPSNPGVKPLNTYLPLFPITIIAIDYIENILIINILLSFPYIGSFWIKIASFFTQIKWTLVIVTLLIIFSLVIRRLRKRK